MTHPDASARQRFLARLVASFIVAILLAAGLQYRPFSATSPGAGPFYFEAVVKAAAPIEVAIGYELLGGRKGISTDQVRRAGAPQLCRMAIPGGHLTSLRFIPAGASGEAAVMSARLVDDASRTIAEFSSAQFLPANPSTHLQPMGQDAFRVRAGTAELAILHVAIDGAPLALASPVQIRWGTAAMQILGAGLVAFFGLVFLETRFGPAFGAVAAWVNARPRVAIGIAAAAAAIVSCHPVVFCGKSFVAPATSAPCLYAPGGEPGGGETSEDGKGSDTGAMVWAHLPYSVVEHRAIFEHGELPLWLRENSCGVALLGQGQSMIGDPIHWLTIVAGGAAWAWDVKFVCAKILFALGIGLCVFALTRHAGVAILLAASSAFLGFFAYRLNHAAFFSVCYAPWILLCWLKVAEAVSWRRVVAAGAALMAVNWIELNSGTAKESAMLLLCLNATGALIVMLASGSKLSRWRKLAAMIWSGVLFVLLSAPAWMVFLTELKQAYTSYNQAKAFQIQPALFIGLFDDLFYRQITIGERHFNPSANFLVLLGVLWAAASWRSLRRNTAAVALALGSLPALALAFGTVSPDVIKVIPFLGNISHIDNTFSCVLIVHLLLLAGAGLQRCCAARPERVWKREHSTALLILSGLLALYFGFVHAAHRTGLAVLPGGEPMPLSPFFTGYAAALLVALAILPGALRRLAAPARRTAVAFGVCALCLAALHFRHGAYVATKFDAYVVNPRTRVDLAARSPAVDLVKSRLSEPARVGGFGEVLTPGFNAVLGLESIGGADAVLNPYHRQLIDVSGIERVWDWRIVLGKDSLPQWQRFADLMNLRYYLGSLTDASKSVPGLRTLGTSDLEVFESETAWPRAFFTDALASYDRAQDFAGLVVSGDGRPFAAAQRAGTGEPPPPRFVGTSLATRVVVPATGYQITSNSTTFHIDAPSPGVAILTEAFAGDDFEVSIDGAPATAFRANHAFNGVLIEKPGRHVISFVYWPRSLTAALWLAACGGLLLAGTGALLFTWSRAPVQV